MEIAYRLESWQNVYIMLGTSAAAIAGLLFVAISLQANSIVKDPVLRVRASANTIMTVMLVINATIILVPQGIVAIGIELCATAFVYIAWAGQRSIQLRKSGRKIPARAIISISLNLLGIIAGISLIFQSGGGMYIAIIQFVAILAWVIFNAWSLLLDANLGQDGARA
jgi:hypothetical protein